jgi:hypothetical protein
MRGFDEHRRECADDVAAFYLYRFGGEATGYSHDEIAGLLGVTGASLNMRKANFKAQEKPGGLRRAAKLTRHVYAALKDLPEPHHRAQAAGILAWKKETLSSAARS